MPSNMHNNQQQQQQQQQHTKPKPIMALDFNAAVKRKYSINPVRRDFIPSRGRPEPHVLWIGCSDSLISETETLDLLSEELFVHRNLGNILSNGDLSSASAVAWAVDLLKVDHIIICGHYDCTLMKPVDDEPPLLQWWYKNKKKMHELNEEFFLTHSASATAPAVELSSEGRRNDRSEEVFVLAEAEWLAQQPNVKQAIQDRGLQIHTLVYDKQKNECIRLVETD